MHLAIFCGYADKVASELVGNLKFSSDKAHLVIRMPRCCKVKTNKYTPTAFTFISLMVFEGQSTSAPITFIKNKILAIA